MANRAMEYVVAAAMLVSLAGERVPAKAPSAAAVIAAQVSVHLSADFGRLLLDTLSRDLLGLERLPDLPGGPSVIRGSGGQSHAPSFLVAVSGGRVFRMGGFPAPELIALDSAWPDALAGADAAHALTRTRTLSRLLDRNGETGIAGLGQVDSISDGRFDAIARTWVAAHSRLPPDRDSATCSPSVCMARVTLLSYQTPDSYVRGIDVTTYIMSFTREGRLTAWTSTSNGR
jgi:hypothetical protein